MARKFPAPQVFNHGPKSVVFNWTNQAKSLYLTISSEKISALLSSPDRIHYRVDLQASERIDQSLLLPAMRAAQLGQSVLVSGNSAATSPLGLF